MNFLLKTGIKFLALYLIAFLSGLLVQHKNVKVNYTRKINHFFLFFLPLFLDQVLAHEDTIWTLIIGALVGFLSLFVYIKPIRSRFLTVSHAKTVSFY